MPFKYFSKLVKIFLNHSEGIIMYTRNLNEFAGITKNVDDFSDGI